MHDRAFSHLNLRKRFVALYFPLFILMIILNLFLFFHLLKSFQISLVNQLLPNSNNNFINNGIVTFSNSIKMTAYQQRVTDSLLSSDASSHQNRET